MNIPSLVKHNPLSVSQGAAQRVASAKGGAHNRLHLWAWVALSAVGIVAIGAIGIYQAYAHDMKVIYDRLEAGSEVVETRHGPMEYYMVGEGPPVLVVHGAGGGYDQGLLLPTAFGGDGFRWIVPSRFGYLGTPLPADASTSAQAEAFAELLDSLGIEQVGILAMSGGVPPSLQFAQRYPERTSALVLLSSAPYTPLTAGDQKLPVPIWVYKALFKSDFPFWLIQKIAPRSLDAMLDVSPQLRAKLIPEEEAMVSSLVELFQPVTWRIDGLNNEGAAIDPHTTYRLEELRAPALVVHAKDDHINPFLIGEYTATHIRAAQFLPLESGGHVLLGHHLEIRELVNAFLRQHMNGEE